MLIESKIKNGYDSMFYVPQTYFKSAHLLNKMALVQSQCSRTVVVLKTVIKNLTLQIFISRICPFYGYLLINDSTFDTRNMFYMQQPKDWHVCTDPIIFGICNGIIPP